MQGNAKHSKQDKNLIWSTGEDWRATTRKTSGSHRSKLDLQATRNISKQIKDAKNWAPSRTPSKWKKKCINLYHQSITTLVLCWHLFDPSAPLKTSILKSLLWLFKELPHQPGTHTPLPEKCHHSEAGFVKPHSTSTSKGRLWLMDMDGLQYLNGMFLT